MRLFVFQTMFCFNFLWASESEANVSNSTICQDIKNIGHVPEEKDDFELEDIEENSFCLFYSTNVVNCSWSLGELEATQIVAHISICNNETLLQSLNPSAEETFEAAPVNLQNFEDLYVVLQFNVLLQDRWTLYTKTYDMHNLEVPPPPERISASLTNENLQVTWSLPNTWRSFGRSCYEYELDIGDGENFRTIPKRLDHTVNVEPRHAYRVRVRARLTLMCHPRPHWSDWSPVVVVEPSVSHLSLLVIVLIMLGIPMILLALLLLVRYQRVCKTFFPPIPRPPLKYMYYLEKNDGLNFHHPTTPVEEEVITVVLYE